MNMPFSLLCQWICANKRRLNCSTRCVVMAILLKQCAVNSLSMSSKKLHWLRVWGVSFAAWRDEKHLLYVHQGNRRRQP